MPDDRTAAEDLERRISALFQGPREDFVPARDALVKELRPRDRSLADDVKALRKPTVAAWALDRAATDDPGSVAELREAGAAVRAAQEAAVAGDAAQLRSATDRRQAVIARLTDAAVAHAGDGHRDEIEATLEAASVDSDIGERLAAGRLQRTHRPPSGLGDLTSLLAASTSGPTPARRRSTAETRRLQHRLHDAEEAVERRTADLARAEQRVAEAARAVDEARRRLERATAERDEVAADLADGGA